MAEPKTKKTDASVADFLARTAQGRLADCQAIAAMMEKATGAKAAMWGPSIVGFGSYPLLTGKKVNEWPLAGFSPRKGELVLYILPELLAKPELMAKLGKHRHGVSCLYIKSLADVNLKVLEDLVTRSVKVVKRKYGV